jgi:hypothetical protein
MGRPRFAYCVWPGLAQLWLSGSWSSLGLAICFGLVLNLALASTLVWTELLPPLVRSASWVLAAVMWTVSAVSSYRWLGMLGADRSDAMADAWYASGVEEYLQGHWFEAEAMFRRLVDHNGQDVEARLMLATLFRHTDRADEAREQLAGLQRMADADRWSPEIGRELSYLAACNSRRGEETAEVDQRPSKELGEAA